MRKVTYNEATIRHTNFDKKTEAELCSSQRYKAALASQHNSHKISVTVGQVQRKLRRESLVTFLFSRDTKHNDV